MHWSLDQVRELHEDEFEVLVEWAKERAERSKGDGDSVDMDKMLDEKKRAEEAMSGE